MTKPKLPSKAEWRKYRDANGLPKAPKVKHKELDFFSSRYRRKRKCPR